MQHTNSRNLTQGSIVKNLLIFAVPYLIANFIQAMYGAVDMAIVGWFADSAGISAVSTGSQVMQIVTSLVSGLTMGGTILIAQYFGANQKEDTTQTISTMLTLFAGAAVVFTVLMLALTKPILWLLQALPRPLTGAYMCPSGPAASSSSLGITPFPPCCGALGIPRAR
ncbi:MAG: MATE family efflux transporter [Oscillospiraceae bacterium]